MIRNRSRYRRVAGAIRSAQEWPDPDHVAHGAFEWDDTAAAHAHRLHQARQLVARYTVTVESGSGKDTRVRAYVNVPSEGRYMRTDRAVANVAWRGEIIEDAKRAARYFTAKYKSLGNDALIALVAEALEEVDVA